jgi:hypothetical protein
LRFPTKPATSIASRCRIALSPFFEEMGAGRTGQHVFPGQRSGRPLSNMAFEMWLRRINSPYTAHGFRSAFRDWAGNKTHFPRELAEHALAQRHRRQGGTSLPAIGRAHATERADGRMGAALRGRGGRESLGVQAALVLIPLCSSGQ